MTMVNCESDLRMDWEFRMKRGNVEWQGERDAKTRCPAREIRACQRLRRAQGFPKI
jgi:hypothetical protein